MLCIMLYNILYFLFSDCNILPYWQSIRESDYPSIGEATVDSTAYASCRIGKCSYFSQSESLKTLFVLTILLEYAIFNTLFGEKITNIKYGGKSMTTANWMINMMIFTVMSYYCKVKFSNKLLNILCWFEPNFGTAFIR